jgi:DNA topoisomerase-1
MPYWKTLYHNGVCFPPEYVPDGLSIIIRGREVKLSPLGEEMAYHLAKKRETQYFKDNVFRSNFMLDFRNTLPEWCKDVSFEEIDFSSVFEKVEREKLEKQSMSKERKKELSAQRREMREKLKEKYGYAILDGVRLEIANWMVEPPGIFIGRGQHPLRGRWKPRIKEEDVILNLGEDAPVPPGRWKEIVHDHNSMWIAKWVDKLTDKEKYVWLHESTPIQQSRNRQKYDNAMRAGRQIERVRERIMKMMSSENERERKMATVCYLIDKLGMRVGDEKEEDEADTVGATTLRVEHVKIGEDYVDFSFLGKDSVPWNKRLEKPPGVFLKNLKEFMKGKKEGEEIFDGINSNSVNRFLSSIVPGLTAKVFRTYHATRVVQEFLKKRDMRNSDEIEKLHYAKLANLEAAIFCNHQRTPPKNWEQSLEKKLQKLSELKSSAKDMSARIKKLELDIDLRMKTKTYNLNTSLKNYIDPRVYKAWCDFVGLDWTKLYTKSLQRKFAWVTRSRAKWTKLEEEVVKVMAN